jgi:hypothetical protein
MFAFPIYALGGRGSRLVFMANTASIKAGIRRPKTVIFTGAKHPVTALSFVL